MKKLTTQNRLFLRFVASCSEEQRKVIIQTTTENQLQLLVEIIFNLIRGVIPIQANTKKLLQQNKVNVRKVVELAVSQNLRRKRLAKINNEIPVIIQAYLKYESRTDFINKTEI